MSNLFCIVLDVLILDLKSHKMTFKRESRNRNWTSKVSEKEEKKIIKKN